MKKIKIIFVLLLAFNCVFSQKSKLDTNQDILEWTQKWGTKKLPLKVKSMTKFNLQLETMLKKEYDRINNIELSSNISEAEKLSRDFSQAWGDIQRINPDVINFLSRNPLFADIEQKVDEAKYLHYIIKSKIAFDNKDFVKAVGIASQHNSSNSKALENEESIKSQTLSWFTEQIIAEYGNTDPAEFVKEIKQFMEFKDRVGFDFAKFPYLENLKGQWNNYDEFIEAMRVTGYNRIINSAENLMSMYSYNAGTDLYNLAKEITLTDDEKNQIRHLHIQLNKYAITYYEEQIEAAFEADDFVKADKLEAKILTFNPHYKKKGTEKKVDFYKQKLDIAFNNFDWVEAANLEKLIKNLHPNYISALPERKYLRLLDIAKEHYQNKAWRKVEAKLEEALDLNGLFDKDEGRELLKDTRNEIGYIVLQKGEDEMDVGNDDLAEEYFSQAKRYLSEPEKAKGKYIAARDNLGLKFLKAAEKLNQKGNYLNAIGMGRKALEYLRYSEDALNVIQNAKDNQGIFLLGEAEDYYYARDYLNAYDTAHRALEYLRTRSKADKIISAATQKLTRRISFVINIGNDGFRIDKTQESDIRSKLWNITKASKGKFDKFLDSKAIPIVTNMEDAKRYARSVDADYVLVLSVESYEKYGGKDLHGKRKKASTFYQFKKESEIGSATYVQADYLERYERSLIVRECSTFYYKKYIDDLRVDIRLSSKWLNLTTNESSDESSKSFSDSFHQEVWKAEYSTVYEMTPHYSHLREYVGDNEECRRTNFLNQTYFKKERRPVPSHTELAYPKLLDFVQGIPD